MASLQILNIDNNAFTSIPPDFFAGFSALQHVSLDDNPLASWALPDDLFKCDSLRDFSASNAFTSIPSTGSTRRTPSRSSTAPTSPHPSTPPPRRPARRSPTPTTTSTGSPSRGSASSPSTGPGACPTWPTSSSPRTSSAASPSPSSRRRTARESPAISPTSTMSSKGASAHWTSRRRAPKAEEKEGAPSVAASPPTTPSSAPTSPSSPVTPFSPSPPTTSSPEPLKP